MYEDVELLLIGDIPMVYNVIKSVIRVFSNKIWNKGTGHEMIEPKFGPGDETFDWTCGDIVELSPVAETNVYVGIVGGGRYVNLVKK